MSRFSFGLLISVFTCFALLGTFMTLGQRPEIPTPPNQELKPIVAPPASPRPQTQRLREGTKFKDLYVFFRQTGDRTVLYTVKDSQRFTCLENLELDRVIRTIREKPGRDYWKIEGEFTEFCGNNFILLRRAVVALPPVDASP